MNRNLFKNIKDHRIFQAIVVFAIILSALLVGASTYNIPPSVLFILHAVDVLITLFFVVEISIRFFSEKRKLHFFKDGWNLFDTIIVIASIIPAGPNSSILVLRLLRIFRVLRLISAIPELKELIESLLKSLKRVFYVSLLLFIIIYVYASIGSILFATSDPNRWGDLGVAMITLFQVLTLSSWETVMLPMQELFWWAWIYFYSFIAIGSITILNLIIAVLVDVVTNKD
jgi:voltage-gated sodium channel